MKRRTLTALLLSLVTVAFTAHTATAAAAHATSVDPELISESITDGGVYIDSAATVFTDDASQDRLRAELETARNPVYVAVLPAGSSLTPAELSRIVNRKGTFAVLTGNGLKATSNVLSSTRLQSALAGAMRGNGASPATALISFVHLTNGAPRTRAGAVAGSRPPTIASQADVHVEQSAPVDQAQVIGPAKKSGDSGALPLIGGVVAALVAVAAGVFLWWRKRIGDRAATGSPATDGTAVD